MTASRTARTALVATLGCVAAALAATPARAEVTTRTYTDGPISVAGYQVKKGVSANLGKPAEDGFITHMEVDVVDPRSGRVVPINRIMLHHVVFGAIGKGRPGSILGSEAFYGAGEERATMDLPPGYGYPVGGADKWAMVWMLMNHKPTEDRVLIRWRLTYDTSPGLKPVTPVTLDASHRRQGLVYDVAGGGQPGSRHVKTQTVRSPVSGRIVAGLGHVHGGAHGLALSQPSCGDRTVYESEPTWGLGSHPFYNVKPVLHEPGPIDMSRFESAAGIPVVAGQPLKLTSTYDNELPHTRVMGLMLVYVAPDTAVTDGCGALPSDVRVLKTSTRGRAAPPEVTVPITGLDARGRAISLLRPPGRLARFRGDADVTVGDLFYRAANVSIPQGASVRWTFGGAQQHNVTLANGPEGFSSNLLRNDATYVKRFTRPGTYRLFCELHPVDMTQRIVVRRAR